MAVRPGIFQHQLIGCTRSFISCPDPGFRALFIDAAGNLTNIFQGRGFITGSYRFQTNRADFNTIQLQVIGIQGYSRHWNRQSISHNLGMQRRRHPLVIRDGMVVYGLGHTVIDAPGIVGRHLPGGTTTGMQSINLHSFIPGVVRSLEVDRQIF